MVFLVQATISMDNFGPPPFTPSNFVMFGKRGRRSAFVLVFMSPFLQLSCCSPLLCWRSTTESTSACIWRRRLPIFTVCSRPLISPSAVTVPMKRRNGKASWIRVQKTSFSFDAKVHPSPPTMADLFICVVVRPRAVLLQYYYEVLYIYLYIIMWT